MKQLRDFGSILSLAAVWAISGYVLGLTIEIMGIPYPMGNVLASLNVIIGMLLFLNVTSNPRFERIFFEGPRPDDEGYIPVGCLWVIPMNLLVIGLPMLLFVTVLRIIFPK